MKSIPSVISVGYGRQLFAADNPERIRMERCAAELPSLHMIVFTHRRDGFSETNGANGLKLYPTNSRSRWCMVWDAIRIGVRIIREEAAEAKPQPLITTQDPFEAGVVGYVLKKRFGVSLTIQEHGDVFSTDFWRRESFGNQIRFQAGKWLLRRADVVRVVAKRMISTMRTIGVSVPITQLPVSIEVARFAAKAKPSPQTAPTTFTYLSVARFVPQKNLPMLIRAFAAAYKKDNRLRLRVVGQGPEEYQVRAEIATQFPPATNPTPPITIESWTDDVPTLMSQVNAYVLSSNYEGWGRVLIEALAARLPVVTTDVGCVGEVVQHTKHGLVVPVGDTDALSDALVTLASDSQIYHHVYDILTALNLETLPGAQLDTYGRDWVSTLSGA